MSEHRNAWDELKSMIEADHHSFACQDDVESSVKASYAKELLQYMKQIEPKDKPTFDDVRGKYLGDRE